MVNFTFTFISYRFMRAACSVRHILLTLIILMIFVTKRWLWVFSLSNIIHRHVLSVLAYSHTRSLAHSLTPWSRVLLQKLTGSQLVKKFPAFYGTRRFITAFTSACHLSLSWARLLVPNITLSILLPNRRELHELICVYICVCMSVCVCVCVCEMCWLQQYIPTQY